MEIKARSKTPKNHCKIALWIFYLLIWVIASIVASQLVIGYLMALILGVDTLSQPVWTAVYSALSYLVALLLIIFIPPAIIKKSQKSDRNLLGLKGLPTWSDIGLAPIGFIVYLLIASILTWLFSLFPWFDAEQVQNVGFSTYLSGAERVIAFFILVVIAPIMEEIIFRGWLYGKIRTKCPMIVSILIVSVVFGIVHFQWNVGVNVSALSIVLCGLREITGTIYSGIILHMLKNGLAFYLLYVLGIS